MTAASQGRETMNLFSEAPDTPMSADLLQRCVTEGSLTIYEIADLLNRAESTAYDYLARTELKYGQARALFRFAQDDRVREAFLADLLAGTGYLAQRVDAVMDFDGDGDIDCDDAVSVGIAAMADAADAADAVRHLHGAVGDRRFKVADAQAILGLLDDVIGQAVQTRNIVAYLRDQAAPGGGGGRKKARPVGHLRLSTAGSGR